MNLQTISLQILERLTKSILRRVSEIGSQRHGRQLKIWRWEIRIHKFAGDDWFVIAIDKKAWVAKQREFLKGVVDSFSLFDICVFLPLALFVLLLLLVGWCWVVSVCVAGVLLLVRELFSYHRWLGQAVAWFPGDYALFP
jgi:VIT1/CCC1 family predicted Fe2+/Mn2+ transporter